MQTTTQTTMQTTTLVRDRDEGQATWFFNALVTTKASMHETGGAYSLTEHLVTAASNPPMHVQLDEDEAFYILDGEVEFEVDGKVITATPGTFAFVARGAPHQFRVLTETARMLIICSGKPSDNLEDFFVAMGEPATERALPQPAAPDVNRLAALTADGDRTRLMLLLVVVAHPDDESFGCGSVLAYAAAAGYDTAVLCASRGEAGESRVRTDDLAMLREAELREASRILGVKTVRLLDHVDSGMTGEPEPGTLAAAEPLAVIAEVRSVIDDLCPDVVVTPDASDGHRDHAVIRDATLAAVDTARHQPAATYVWCLARSSMARWAHHVHGTGNDAYLSVGELGTPDEDITTLLDVASHLPKRWEAMRAHLSQASPYDDLPQDLQEEFLTVDRLKLVRGVECLAG